MLFWTPFPRGIRTAEGGYDYVKIYLHRAEPVLLCAGVHRHNVQRIQGSAGARPLRGRRGRRDCPAPYPLDSAILRPVGPGAADVLPLQLVREVMRCADRLRSHLLRGRSQGPAKVIQSRRGQRFRRVFFSPWWGPPLPGRFAALLPSSGPLCASPPWRLCAAFSFSGCKFTRLYFSFVLRLPCACAWRLRPSVSVYGVSRGPLWAVPVAVGLAYPAADAPAWGLLGRRGRSGSRRGRRRAGRVRQGQADFFRGSSLIAPPGLPGVCLPAPKSLRQSRKVESR